jgi:acyl carrier protein
MAQIERSAALSVATAALTEVLELNGTPVPPDLGEATVLVGQGAVIDSLGVVSLIVQVEQLLEMDHDVSVTLANDRAMSERNSPFRTVGVLADHIVAMAGAA